MNKIQRRLVSAAASAALLLNTLTPAFAATTLEISGNGSDSTSTTSVAVGQTTTVSQTNSASVVNNIVSNADTGNNDANDNTGGDVNVETGDATIKTTVSNDLNHNTADVDRCNGCGFSDVDVKISGNGTGSNNTAGLTVGNTTTVAQTNVAGVVNAINNDADTGDNDADDNTGGDVSVKTGDVKIVNHATTVANSNSASIGGGNGEGGSVSVLISGNGSDTDNTAALQLGSATVLGQTNSAAVVNAIVNDADTGDNDAEDNTGGDVSVETGDIDMNTEIDNALNSNSAHIMGGGEGAMVSAIISGNGSDSDNAISLAMQAITALTQANMGAIENVVDNDADTGDNDANDNTGGEVSIDTGDIDIDVMVDNAANFNVADVECDCLFDSVLAKIANNGTESDNTIGASLGDTLAVGQTNVGSSFLNNLMSDADTGDNDAEDNGGSVDGDPAITTGDVDIDVDASNSGNANVYGDHSDVELPLPGGVNLNISFDLSDLLEWLMENHA